MADFHTEIRQRIVDARRSLSEARATGDDYLADVRMGEIQSLTRIAVEHEVALDLDDVDGAVEGATA